jgi:hypothetical protein
MTLGESYTEPGHPYFSESYFHKIDHGNHFLKSFQPYHLTLWDNDKTPKLGSSRFAAFAVREKCKAGAFIFPHRGPRSGPEPEGLKGGKPASSTGDAPRTFRSLEDTVKIRQ